MNIPKIVTVSGFKGGVGKTITAVHIAGYFATNERYKDKKVLLIDGDGNRSAKSWAAKARLPFKCVTSNQSMRYISLFDIIIADTAASPLEDDLLELADASQLIILPTKTDGLSLEPTLRAAELIREFNYKILICAAPPYPAKDGKLLQEELRNNNYRVFNTTIRSTKGFGMAAEQGILIKDLKHASRTAAFDYNDLCVEIGVL